MSNEGLQRTSNRREGIELITSSDLIIAANELMGGITLDVASSKVANEYVGAENFYTPADDGLNAQQWYGKAYLFPPAGMYFWDKKNGRWKKTRASAVSLTSSHAVWFRRMYHAWISGEIEQGLYFSNCPDMIRYEPKIFSFPMCILRTRPVLQEYDGKKFSRRQTCTSFVVYLPPTDLTDDATQRFKNIYEDRGHILI
jgi:hypothetical protein